MSYTIPTSVQTKAEAVLAVASAIADEDMGARYDGTVNTSLDVLADVLAAQDVDVPQTNAGAILALAQYAHGGGGGGVQLGTVNRVFADDRTAASGDEINGSAAILTISIGNAVVTHWDEFNGRMSAFAAAGTTVSAAAGPYDAEMTNTVVVRTFTVDGYNYGTISEPIDLPVSTSTMETPDGSMVVATFTMPELPDGTGILVSVVH